MRRDEGVISAEKPVIKKVLVRIESYRKKHAEVNRGQSLR